MDTSLWWNAFPSSHVASPQFPIELLQVIFLLLADFYPRRPSRPTCPPHWIAITYVCRYWRQAALSLRELWTHITPSLSISWSQAMMERSAPLPVHIDRRVGTKADVVEALATSGLLSASRIRALHLTGYPAHILKVFNCLCDPSPLESLTLYVFNAVEAVYLPETLCARDTPNLRRLTFETTRFIRMPLWLLAGITHFTTSVGNSMDELLCTLQAMPQLKELCIKREFDHVDSELVHRTPAHVALPHLLLLTTYSSSPRPFVVLSTHIVDAPATTLRRHLFWRDNHHLFWRDTFLPELELDILARVLDLVPRDSASGADDGGLRAAQVTGGAEIGSFEVWSRMTPTARAARSDALFLLRLDWQRSCFLESLQEAAGAAGEHCPLFHLASLCAHLQTTRVEDLTVAPSSKALAAVEEEYIQPKEVAQWRALLVALPSVKILRLHGGSSAASILHALAVSPGLLPYLRKVFVVHSIIRCAGGVADTDAGTTKNMGAELVEAVSVWSGLEVVLVGCEVDEEALEALRKRAQVDFGNEWEYMQNLSLG